MKKLIGLLVLSVILTVALPETGYAQERAKTGFKKKSEDDAPGGSGVEEDDQAAEVKAKWKSILGKRFFRSWGFHLNTGLYGIGNRSEGEQFEQADLTPAVGLGFTMPNKLYHQSWRMTWEVGAAYGFGSQQYIVGHINADFYNIDTRIYRDGFGYRIGFQGGVFGGKPLIGIAPGGSWIKLTDQSKTKFNYYFSAAFNIQYSWQYDAMIGFTLTAGLVRHISREVIGGTHGLRRTNIINIFGW